MSKIMAALALALCLITGTSMAGTPGLELFDVPRQLYDPKYLFVIELPYKQSTMRPGWEDRGPQYIRWLAPSVRISSNGGSGSMVYYDETNNYMYVISAGHLFRQGRFRRQQGSPEEVYVDVFYHNNVKLQQPKRYVAEVMTFVWSGINDVSLVRFKPDWKDPWCAPIASADFVPEQGKWYHSCGCDGMSEVAHYSVMFVEERQMNGITEYRTQGNAPRGGRSGGGVFTDEGYLFAICSRGGGDTGLWTSLRQIRQFLHDEKYDFVADGSPARQIMVLDRTQSQGKYAKTYIPLPKLDQSGSGVKLPQLQNSSPFLK